MNAFNSMTKELKRQGKAVVEHHPPINDDDLETLYAYLSSDRESRQLLQYNVFVDLMLHFGRRGRENLATLKRSDFAVTTDAKHCMYVYKDTEERTKNHQDDSDRSGDGRMYEIKENERCPVRSL
ncbi:uncharacterized protein LOC110447319 [Mizuhopecten yessoensis]|uniref:uncharacterized protein LOC110447319 n=1 Tax=Mizuhopecten yessoensis TaxID=6573 RepID=UPI000B45B3A7|nr:uncharacterized protein LOC110447319 [Mizuhopecten yessoensis]